VKREANCPKRLMSGNATRSANGADVVYVVKADRVERRAVRLGAVDGELIEVVTGLSAGERVVVDGPADLADGDRIVVRS